MYLENENAMGHPVLTWKLTEESYKTVFLHQGPSGGFHVSGQEIVRMGVWGNIQQN